MYSEHNPVIANAMRASVDGFTRGATFAVLSIRQRIYNVPAALQDVDESRSESVYLLGHKRDAYRHLLFNGPRLHAALCAAQGPLEAITTLLEVPGLGIAKSAFVAQLMGFDVACIDSRNAVRLGHGRRAWREDRKMSRSCARKVSAYVDAYGGRAEEFWNDWCADVANAYPTVYASANEVSAEHLAIVPDDFIPF